jgi:hypothetical protein
MVARSSPVGGAPVVCALLLSALIYGPSPVLAAPIVSLGAASSFGVLAGTTVTNSGGTVINGNLGVSPGSAITGFGPGTGQLGPGIVNGTQFTGATSAAGTAQIDLTTAFNNLAGLSCGGGNVLTGMNLGSRTLTPGVYCFTSGAQLTGTLTLNEMGESNPEFVFQVASLLNTAVNSSVVEINGGADNNIFWQVGSSATLGTGTDFVGNIVALTSISLGTGARIACGSALAQNGAVTLLDDVITANTDPACVTDAAAFVVSEPSSFMVLGTALFALVEIGRRRSQFGSKSRYGEARLRLVSGPA